MIKDMTIANRTIVSRLTARYYPRSGTDPLDAAFCDYARPGMTVLDAGCGGLRGCAREAPWEQMHIIGVDMDPAVYDNPFCDDRLVCNLESLPFADNSFDMIHCRWVLEHLREPLTIFREFARILKPSGRLLALTPNILHYAMIAAMVTPQRFHRWWRRGQYEPFETYYKANTPAKLHRLCANAGLSVQRLELIEEQPDYLARYWPAFLCGVLYERLVNSTPVLKWIRQRILLVAAVPAAVAYG